MADAAPNRGPSARTVTPVSFRSTVLARLSAGHLVMIVAGLVGMLLTVALLRSADSRRTVAVAAHDLPAGGVFTKSSVRYEPVKMGDGLLETVLERDDVARLDGSIAAHTIRRGQLISRVDLRRSAAPARKRAMSVPVNPSRAVNGELDSGDRVDVLVAADHEVAIIVPNAEVLEVHRPDRGGAFGGVEDAFTVTLAVDARESQLLAAAIADGDLVVTRTTGAQSSERTPPLPIDRSAGGTKPPGS